MHCPCFLATPEGVPAELLVGERISALPTGSEELLPLPGSIEMRGAECCDCRVPRQCRIVIQGTINVQC